MSINLYEYQKVSIDKLKSGSILCGGVGSGKSRTALAYFVLKECGGNLKINGSGDYKKMKTPKPLFIITTARKRDTLDWEHECIPFRLSTDPKLSINRTKVTIDSWNNINKYAHVNDAFFIFDEQRVVGSGSWVKSFLKITKKNNWILLSATPGDTWHDYIPVFVANGFYKNRTEFLRRHAVYNRFTRYPKIEKYIETNRLEKLRDLIIVDMQYVRPTTRHNKTLIVPFDKDKADQVLIKRWNIYEDRPIRDISEVCYLLRKIVNSDPRRISAIEKLLKKNPKVIIFYNFDYELELLRKLSDKLKISKAEWNGHKHELIPNDASWIYLVQYTAGAEGWNCIETDVIIFYSQNYSYKIMTQAAGRIDRLNTPFTDLYYYHLRSNSLIDLSIFKALKNKKTFNESRFMNI